jgi:putative transcriptional regulator
MTVHYTACRLPYVYLRNGYLLRHGEGIVIRDAESLHEAIAVSIITRVRPLRGQEVRFLRSALKMSQASLARGLQITRVTVARWEGAPDEPIPGIADTALRLFCPAKRGRHELAQQVCRLLSELGAHSARRQTVAVEERLVLRQTPHGWEPDSELDRASQGKDIVARRTLVRRAR